MKLSECARALESVGISDALWEARLLFTHFAGYAPAALIGCDPVSDSPVLADAFARRLKREPLQYILREVGFCRETYRVTPDCLIPRPDTELVVETAVRLLPPHAHFADLCTGSGCIAVSTLAARTDCTADAYDVSEKALALARENAERNGVSDRLAFYLRDLLCDPPTGTYAAILSNPPYIPDAVVDTLAPEVGYEPRIALAGGRDGLDFYRAILMCGRACLAPSGFFVFEIGYDQKTDIERLAEECTMQAEVLFVLGGNPRCAVLKK